MPRSTGRTYSAFRFFAPALLLIHLGIRLIFSNPSIFADLFLYNFVALVAAITVLLSPTFNDFWSKVPIFLSMLLWSIGSTVSSWNSFMRLQLPNTLTDICYSLFYPLILFGLVRALTTNKKILSLELFDTTIIALGSTSVISGLLLRPAMLHFRGSPFAVFLAILYPVGDVVLVAITISLILLQKRNTRTMLTLIGVAIFAASDLYFLYISNKNTYNFGALTDDGWLLALIVISQALWSRGGEVELNEKINNYAVAITLTLSSIIIAIAALKPNYLPTFVLIPAFATLVMAFIRMALAIRDAKHVTTERELARTDELTGLPNRRRFLIELDLLIRREGTLLILDLNGFKQINDRYGHEVGDQLLKQVATRFSRSLAPDVLLARLGGDEFGAIIYGPAQLAREATLAIRSTLSYPFSLSVGDVSIGVAIGAAENNESIKSKEDLLRAADGAMYEAKRSGPGLVERGK